MTTMTTTRRGEAVDAVAPMAPRPLDPGGPDRPSRADRPSGPDRPSGEWGAQPRVRSRCGRLDSLAPASRAQTVRRRVVAVVLLLLVAFAVTGLLGAISAEAELQDPVAGHVVVPPGGTLWEVAVDSAPDGVDPRAHLEAIRDLNGLEGSQIEAWQVVLLPHH